MREICACEVNGSILGPGLIRHRSVQPFFQSVSQVEGRAYFILSSLRKNIKLKLALNNAVMKGWKTAFFISINGSV